MGEVQRCVLCGAPVRTTNYALGPEVEHYDPASSFPSRQRGTAWLHCRVTVATLPPVLDADPTTPSAVRATHQEASDG